MTRLGKIGAIGAACVAACLGTGAWVVRRGTVPAGQPGGAILAQIPASAGGSGIDRELRRCAEEARRKPEQASAWADLGDALMQKARDTQDAAYYGHAERVYGQSLRLEPRSVQALAGMAWVYGCRHEFERSIALAKQAVALDPKRPDAYGILGDAELETGEYEAAGEHYQKMLDLRPDLSSYSRGARFLYVTGNFRKAIFLMEKAVAAGGPYAENTAWCRAQLGLMLWSWGAYPAAEQVLRQGLEKAPRSYPLLAAMGKVKASRRDYDAAIEYYQRAVAVVPQHEAVAALGDLYRLTGRRAEAEKQYALVEAIHRLNAANGVRGDMQIALFYADHDRNLPQALQQAEAEYQTRKNVYAADTLAWCLYKNGRLEEAKEMARKALRYHTPEAGFLYHAGMIHARLGDRARAQKYLYQALSVNSEFHPVFAGVAARTLAELGTKTASR